MRSTLIGVTQRVVDVSNRDERRDALDQAWTVFLHACGLEILPLPNRHPDIVEYVKDSRIMGCLLTGGNNLSEANSEKRQSSDVFPERDETEKALVEYATEIGLPVLGVCRGMQMLNIIHGGIVSEIKGHANTRHAIMSFAAVEKQFSFDSTVNSYHDWAVTLDNLAPNCDALYVTDNCVEVMHHNSLPHLGVMWHPERNKPFSKYDLKNVRQFFRGGT